MVVVVSLRGEGRESVIVAGRVKGAAAGNPEELHLEFSCRAHGVVIVMNNHIETAHGTESNSTDPWVEG